jgi:Na+/phosphate symporter
MDVSARRIVFANLSFLGALAVVSLFAVNLALASLKRNPLEYVVRLETADDVVAQRLAVLAGDLKKAGGRFSEEAWRALHYMHETIFVNMKLAANVLISDVLERARLLNMEKTEIKRAERDSRKRHFTRLQDGEPHSFARSDIHLENLRAFRNFKEISRPSPSPSSMPTVSCWRRDC